MRTHARKAPKTPTDAVICASHARLTDENGMSNYSDGLIEDRIAARTGLSRRRVAQGLDRCYVSRGIKLDEGTS